MKAGLSGGPRGGWVPALSAAGAPASRAFRCGIRKGAHSPSAGSAAAASPRALSQARRRRGGRDWARKAAGRDLEKPPRLHCSGRGRWRSRFPRAACPRGVLRARFPGARPCGARGLVRGPRAAPAGGGEQPVLPTHTPGGRLLLRKCYSCSGSPARPVL